MAKLIQIVAPNPHYVPSGYYTAIFNQAYDTLKYQQNGTRVKKVLDLEFLIALDPNKEPKRIKKSYPLPNNHVVADLLRYLGDDFSKVMDGAFLDLDELNKCKGRCAEIKTGNFQGEYFPVPFSMVEEFYPCALTDEEEVWEVED